MSDIYLTDEQYLRALRILLDRLKKGVELIYYDDTTIGAKETHNSWGLCSTDAESWPDPDIHLWPDQFVARGRVAPRYRQEGQWCPNDRRVWGDMRRADGRKGNMESGCFWTCMFFQPVKGASKPNREQVKAMTLTLIERFVQQD